MTMLHDKSICDDNLVPKEGQPDLLCSNKKSQGCPSLSYTDVTNEQVKKYIALYLTKYGIAMNEHEARMELSALITLIVTVREHFQEQSIDFVIHDNNV
jgi:hypothetical protein